MHELFSSNISWMTYNTMLAVIPVFLGWLVYAGKNKYLTFVLFLAWLAFVPNTIYIFTDVIHYIKVLRSSDYVVEIFMVTIQYILFFFAGFMTYILSLYPIEKTIERNIMKENGHKAFKGRKNTVAAIILLNFLIGIGIVLGRIYRLNSWDIVLSIEDIVISVMHVITSPEMTLLALLFGLFANFMYFLLKKPTIKYLQKKI